MAVSSLEAIVLFKTTRVNVLLEIRVDSDFTLRTKISKNYRIFIWWVTTAYLLILI